MTSKSTSQQPGDSTNQVPPATGLRAPSIEEAFSKVLAESWYVKEYDTQFTTASEDVKAIARAAMLAVLEESATGWNADPVTYLQQAAAHHDTLKARIVALGKGA